MTAPAPARPFAAPTTVSRLALTRLAQAAGLAFSRRARPGPRAARIAERRWAHG
jgi:hypothetical protein